MVENHLARGKLEKMPCERCGSSVNVHAHHDDYSRPLDVMWLCAKHHKERHKELRAGSPPLQREETPALGVSPP